MAGMVSLRRHDIRAEAHGAATQLPEAREPDRCALRAMRVPNRQVSRRTQTEDHNHFCRTLPGGAQFTVDVSLLALEA
jgi:hypothetical protein